MQHHAAHQLHVEMALAERALGRLAHRGEGLGQQVVERLAFGEARAELAVLARSSSSESFSSSGSSALICSTERSTGS